MSAVFSRLSGRFDDLRIRTKLYAGFGVALALLAVVGTIGVSAILGGERSIGSIARYAAVTDAMADADLAMSDSLTAVRAFIASADAQQAAAISETLELIMSNLQKAQGLYVSEANKKRGKELIEAVEVYQRLLSPVMDLIVKRESLKTKILEEEGRAMRDELMALREALSRSGQTSSALMAADTAETFMLARIILARIAYSGNTADADEAFNQIEVVHESLVAMAEMDLKGVDGTIKRASVELSKYRAGAKELVETVMAAGKQLGELRTVALGVNESTSQVKLAARDAQNSVIRDAAVDSAFQKIAVGGLVIFALALGTFLAWIIARAITAPVQSLTGVMGRLANRDWTAEVPARARTDEVGDMARAVQVFKDNGIENERLQREAESNRLREEEAKRDREARERQAEEEKRRREEESRLAEERRQQEAREAEARQKAEAERRRRAEMLSLADGFERAVGAVVEGVASAASQMQALAQQMVGAVDQTNSRAANVAAASEQASANVQTVASATEELASSVAEIGRQVTTSTRIAGEAVAQAGRTNAQVEGLTEAARRIGEIITLIQDIASKTNLLALNATIEAARAGDAGKGFAVVASEVKTLAQQTAKATDEIARQVAEIQSSVGEAAGSIRGIGQTIDRVSGIATTIASAVEEQGAATQEIARNVQQAASGTQEVSTNITGVSQVARETRGAADQVLSAAGDLTRQAESLRGEVMRFVEKVRAA